MVYCGEFSTGGRRTETQFDKDAWISACQNACGEEQDCKVGIDPAQSTPIIDCRSWFEDCAGGRRTEGLGECSDMSDLAGEALGLTQMAELEAQSVPAFGRLLQELRAHGAPRSLQRKASRSRRDERRHRRVVGALAKRAGGKQANIPNMDLPVRSLEAMARENAVEGCVRELYGAYVAHWQAETSKDVAVRGTMRRIARDELRHAAFAWQVHGWAMAKLPVEARARIAHSMREAKARLSWPMEGEVGA